MSSMVSLNNATDIGFMWTQLVLLTWWTAVKDNSSGVAKFSISIWFILMGEKTSRKEVQGKVSPKVINLITYTLDSVFYV